MWGKHDLTNILPSLGVEARELIQDIDLHRSDLTKLVCGMDKLLYWPKERERMFRLVYIHNHPQHTMMIMSTSKTSYRRRLKYCYRQIPFIRLYTVNTLHTFSEERVFAAAGECAVDFANEFHVVEEWVEGVEVGEADHVRGPATCYLETANTTTAKSINTSTNKLYLSVCLSMYSALLYLVWSCILLVDVQKLL